MKNTIKENREFVYAYRKGIKCITPYFIFYVAKNNLGINKLGITVSKAIGKAHSRNLAKRLIREGYRHSLLNVKKGHNIVVVARDRILNADFSKICGSMKFAAIKTELIETTDTGDGNA